MKIEFILHFVLYRFYFSLLLVQPLIKLIRTDEFVNEYVVQIPSGYSDAKSIAMQMGMILHHKLMGTDDLYVFQRNGKNIVGESKFHSNRLKRHTKVLWIEQQSKLTRVKRARLPSSNSIYFNDPLYKDQWYLTRSSKDASQYDMNVAEAWKLGYTGQGVVVSILDDGIDYRHADLKENYDPMASHDINGHDNDPLPNVNTPDNKHGTRCAGEVSASANNNKCGVGVAYNSKIGGVRMLDGQVTDRVEAEALGLRQHHIDIYSGSWGPDDNGQKLEGPGKLASAAFQRGALLGRQSLGNIFVWASGNGGQNQDSCACDGYAGSIYTLSVSSVSEHNHKPWYLESCSSTIATTYSSGNFNEHKIITTDINDLCAIDHTGTSASAPLAAGIIALLLEANQNLTWRDVQYITILTANTKPFVDGKFMVNGANHKVSSLYGFGLMDAGKMVRLGHLWISLPDHRVCRTSFAMVRKALTGRSKILARTQVAGCSGASKINYVEHVVLRMMLNFSRRGEVRILVISPSGTESELLPYRSRDGTTGQTQLDRWPLMSAQFWGEKATGDWSVRVEGRNPLHSGYWTSFQLELYGTEQWPVRLNPPLSGDIHDDQWFRQFERFVVLPSAVTDQDTNVTDIDLSSPDNQTAMPNNPSTSSDPIQCHRECVNNKCRGKGPNNCITCRSLRTHNGICVSVCPLDTFLLNGICEKCHFSCDSCHGPKADQCNSCFELDRFLTADQLQCGLSVTSCAQGSYRDGEVNKCHKCSAQCSVCGSASHCAACAAGAVLGLYSQCGASCPVGSYEEPGRLHSRRCRVCHPTCLACSGGSSPHHCLSCPHASFLLPGKWVYRSEADSRPPTGRCISHCPFGYFFNTTAAYCYECHSQCKTCSGPKVDACLSCAFPLTHRGSSCVDSAIDNCEPDQYKASNGSCIKCGDGCRTCVEGSCTSCLSAHLYIHANSCVASCPAGYFAAESQKMCLSCSDFCLSSLQQNSTGLARLSWCHSCLPADAPSMLEPQVQLCPASQFPDNINGSTQCEQCSSSCTECSGGSAHDCTSCGSTTALQSTLSDGRECVARCAAGRHSLTLAVGHTVCANCHPSCEPQSCQPKSGQCTACARGHQLSKSSGRCERIVTCFMERFWVSRKDRCGKCPDECRSCIEPLDAGNKKPICTSCRRGSCLDIDTNSCLACCSSAGELSSLATNETIVCAHCQPGKELCPVDADIYNRNVKTALIFRHPVGVVVMVTVLLVAVFLAVFLVLRQVRVLRCISVAGGTSAVKYRRVGVTENIDGNGSPDDDVDDDDDDGLTGDSCEILPMRKFSNGHVANGDLSNPSLS